MAFQPVCLMFVLWIAAYPFLNRRVEDDMRPLVRSAMSGAASSSRANRKASERDTKDRAQTNAESSTPPKATMDSSLTSSNNAIKPLATPDTSTHSSRNPATEFARTNSSQPRRLNDVAQAPLSLRIGARLISKANKAQAVKAATAAEDKDDGQKDRMGLSVAQKRMMELEREKAIARYRAMKITRDGSGVGPKLSSAKLSLS